MRVRFSRHDVTSAVPAPGGGRFDLARCRNVLICLQDTTQLRATRRLLDMICGGGALCLGEAAWPPAAPP
jgi:chemotaxis methyl-accepting protein methylase